MISPLQQSLCTTVSIPRRVRVTPSSGADSRRSLEWTCASHRSQHMMPTTRHSLITASRTPVPRTGYPVNLLTRWSRKPDSHETDVSPQRVTTLGRSSWIGNPMLSSPTGHTKPVSYRLDFSKDGMRWQQVEDYTNVADPRFTHGDLPTTGTWQPPQDGAIIGSCRSCV